MLAFLRWAFVKFFVILFDTGMIRETIFTPDFSSLVA